MKLIDQVITLSQAKRLKELGVKQQSVAFFIGDELHLFEKCFYNWAEQKGMNAVAAFTVAELGVMFDDHIGIDKAGVPEYKGWFCFSAGKGEYNYYPTEASARGRKLIISIEKGLIKVEEVNARLCG